MAHNNIDVRACVPGEACPRACAECERRTAFTRQETRALMNDLRCVFDSVCLVAASTMSEVEIGADGAVAPLPYKPACWRGSFASLNVIEHALQEKGRSCKLVFVGEELYQVVARYLEVGGEAMILEMAMRMSHLGEIEGISRQALTEAIASRNRLLYLDPVSGVYNRRYYQDNYEELSLECGVAFIDVDNFKMVNDSYGHAAGDALLHAIAAAIATCIRPSDKVIRYAGDEFIIIFEHIPRDVLRFRLEGIRRKVGEVAIPSAPGLRVSVSIGGEYGEGKIRELVNLADMKLYEAKKVKDTVCC